MDEGGLGLGSAMEMTRGGYVQNEQRCVCSQLNWGRVVKFQFVFFMDSN